MSLTVGILLFIALILFVVSALAPERRPSFIPWGLAAWVASQLVPLLFRLLVVALYICIAGAAMAQEPAAAPIPATVPGRPWWADPGMLIGVLVAWSAVITVGGGALVAAFVALKARYNAEMEEVKKRQNRATQEKQIIQNNVTQLATMVDPANAKPLQTLPPPAVGGD